MVAPVSQRKLLSWKLSTSNAFTNSFLCLSLCFLNLSVKSVFYKSSAYSSWLAVNSFSLILVLPSNIHYVSRMCHAKLCYQGTGGSRESWHPPQVASSAHQIWWHRAVPRPKRHHSLPRETNWAWMKFGGLPGEALVPLCPGELASRWPF